MKEAGDKGKLVVISGPTAVGKSRLAAELGRAVNGEVISADSMQVYRYMDIGSAKVTKEEMLGVPHHMLDVADPKEAMDASRYKTMAEEWIRDVQSRGRLPIVCGGTGFYIQALVRDIDFTETRADQAKRSELEAFAKENGLAVANRDGIAKVSSSALEGRPVTVCMIWEPTATPDTSWAWAYLPTTSRSTAP